MRPVEPLLKPSETLCYRAAMHGMAALGEGVACGIALLMLAYQVSDLWYGVLLVCSILLMSVFIEKQNTIFAVTTNRLLVDKRWISPYFLEIPLDRIEHVAIDQGITGRLFDFGTVILWTSSGASFKLHFVCQPLIFRDAIVEAIEQA